MKSLINEKINIIGTMNKECNFKDICDDLDKKHKEYLSGNMKTYSLDKVWDNFLNRKNTFLTRK